MSDFSRDWLKLREEADLAARDPALARRFAAALPASPGRPVRLIDLGAGTGANCRALMPRIARDQDWLLVDRDRGLIAAQEDAFMSWARRQGYPIRGGGGHILIEGRGAWSIESVPLDLSGDAAKLEGLAADGVTAAAWFDLVSRDWLEALAATLALRKLPLLCALTVDGVRRWDPPLAEDGILDLAFRRHQSGAKGFGPALGPAAPRACVEIFARAGFEVAEGQSDWRLGPREGGLLEALIAEAARVAIEVAPGQDPAIRSWEKARTGQLKDGKLSLTVGHRDLLALPR